MATSSSNDGSVTSKIVAKGIPSNLNPDKLIIYFQRRKVGGGDVRSVTFPVSSSEPETAIIEFEELETIHSVLRHTHTIGGKPVAVSVLQPKPKIFQRVIAQISDYIVEKISVNNTRGVDILESIMDSTGCTIKYGNNAHEITGEWYQIQAAYERLESFTGKTITESESARINGYEARTVSPRTSSRVPSVPESKVSALIDKDNFAYTNMAYFMDVAEIKRNCNVDFSCTIVGDAAKIEMIPTSDGADTRRAVKSITDLSQKAANSASQDVVQLDSNLPPETVEGIFNSLRPEFPMVHMDRVHDAPNTIMFIAPDNQKCTMAVNMFKHSLQSGLGDSNTASTGPSGEDEKTLLHVDKDLFAYMELTKRANMDRIWNTCGVRTEISTIDDCTKIKLLPKGSRAAFNPENASHQFMEMFNHVSEKAFQDTYDLKNAPNVTKQTVSDAITTIMQAKKDVHIARTSDPSYVIFIADMETKCQDAVELFKGKIENA